MWVRGLKRSLYEEAHKHLLVAPYVGAWIETIPTKHYRHLEKVAPYVGAWIETSKSLNLAFFPLSHPMWVRGLKQKIKPSISNLSRVAPYVGAWIETVQASK